MKYAFIKQHADVHAVTRLCEALGVSSSGYYDWRNRKVSERSRENEALVSRIKTIHSQVMETYGSPRIHAELTAQGQQVSLGRVERLMRENHIQAKQSRRHKRTHQHREGKHPRKISSTASSTRWSPIGNGCRTSPSLKQARAGFTWPSFWICIPARSSAGP